MGIPDAMKRCFHLFETDQRRPTQTRQKSTCTLARARHDTATDQCLSNADGDDFATIWMAILCDPLTEGASLCLGTYSCLVNHIALYEIFTAVYGRDGRIWDGSILVCTVQ
jgi:hypothetical protein